MIAIAYVDVGDMFMTEIVVYCVFIDYSRLGHNATCGLIAFKDFRLSIHLM